ncbi:MAG TPA: NACHT domain-containing protein [Ktedonobacteraceae bacterium]
MVEPLSIGIAIGFLVKNAVHWFPALRDTIIGAGKEAALKKGRERVQMFLDERKHLRHVELALQNAAERGARQWQTPEKRTCYTSILQILSEGHHEALRQEALRLFTLSDDPDLAGLTEKYNLSQRITALAHHTSHTEVDAAPYLHSFFAALLAELYQDALFREQMSDVIRVRAARQGTRSLEEICQTLHNIQGLLSGTYTSQAFQCELEAYLEYIEKKYRLHKFAGIVMRGDENQAPELDHIFVSPRIILSSHATSSPDETSPVDLIALLEQYAYLVLLGDPGSGKSTTTCYLCWLHAKANLATTDHSIAIAGPPLPLRIELRLLSQARRQNPEYNFLSYTTQVLLGREHVSVSPQMLQALLERRHLFVLFDGLDEVATLSERRQLVEQIELFTRLYPGNRVLVTSRPVGYELASMSDPAFHHAEIQPFDDAQIHQFLESWYRSVLCLSPLPADMRQELELFFNTLQEDPRLHRLAVNPLLLTVMTALHRYERLPAERVLIYDKCADLLLDTWARLKHEGVRWEDMKLSKEDQKACLAHLGFVLHQRAQEFVLEEYEQQKPTGNDTAVDVPASFLRKELRRFLANQNLLTGAEQHTEAERLLEMVRTEAGLIVSRGTDEDGEPLYGFVHRTFQEYFAALDVLNRYQQEDDSTIIRVFFADHVHDPHWQEVILLLFGKLKHKFATGQLRLILAGETRRSAYSDTLKQDLFFVAQCLADGIVVDQNFASEVIAALSQVIRETPFPTQRRDALLALFALSRTRRYSEPGKQAQQRILQSSEDLSWLLHLARAVYERSPWGSKEQCEGARLLLTRYQQGGLSLDQQIQLARTVCECSSWGSEEQREGARLLLAHYQQGGLPLDQQIQLAQTIFTSSPSDSEEHREGARLLLTHHQQGGLSLDQQIQLARVIFASGSSDSEEQHKSARLLLARYQQGGLSLDQQIQLARALYLYSHPDSEEEREGVRVLLAIHQHGGLSLDQQIQLAQALYRFSPSGSQTQHEGARLLLARYQQGGLSLDQQIQLAQALYRFSPSGSQTQHEGARLLLARYQQGGLSLDQQIQLAQAIYVSSPSDSEEQREGARLLLARYQQGGLSLDQQIQLAQTIFALSRPGTEEEHESARLLLARYQQGGLSLDQQIQLAQALYLYSRPGSKEEREGARLLLARYRQGGLSLDQQIQLAQAIYASSPSGSEEEHKGFQFLHQILQNTHIEAEIRLNLVLLPYNSWRPNFEERARNLSILLTFTDKNEARNLLDTRWQEFDPLAIEAWRAMARDTKPDNAFLAAIPAIFILATHDLVPLRARDRLYQLLQYMVPSFTHIDKNVSQNEEMIN